jgi:hypothetical protein
MTTGAIGDLAIVHVLQDGTNASPPTIASVAAGIEDLAGTNQALTSIGAFDVGSAVAAKQHLWIGRWYSASAVNINVGIGGGDDIYARGYRFRGVNLLGTTLSDVIENASAGATSNGANTGTTVSDTAVQTLGADRLALNFVGINDDATGIAAFAGASGGTWAMPASFESSTGTDGTIALMTAGMASAGTIDGGSDTITSDAWGVVGFALIPASTGRVPRSPGVDSGFGHMCSDARRNWNRLRSGLLLPDRGIWTPDGAVA